METPQRIGLTETELPTIRHYSSGDSTEEICLEVTRKKCKAPSLTKKPSFGSRFRQKLSSVLKSVPLCDPVQISVPKPIIEETKEPETF